MCELRILVKKSQWKETRIHNIESVTGKLVVISETEDESVFALPYSGYIDTSILEVLAENSNGVIIC